MPRDRGADREPVEWGPELGHRSTRSRRGSNLLTQKPAVPI